ncbi:MAG: cytochrome c [Rhodospirillales bacterium]
MTGRGLFLAAALAAGLALAAPARAQGIVELRQQGMQIMQQSMDRLIALEQAPPAAYRPREVLEMLFRINNVLPGLKRLFPNSPTARGGRASPVIWQLRTVFDGHFDEAIQHADRAMEMAKRLGTARQIMREELGGLARACNACHTQFLLN